MRFTISVIKIRVMFQWVSALLFFATQKNRQLFVPLHLQQLNTASLIIQQITVNSF